MCIEPEDLKILKSQDILGNYGKTWTVKKDNVFGRYLVATRNIEAGEAVFTEDPLTSGPALHNSHLLCVGCNRHTEGEECRGCGWPICGNGCPLLSVHLNNECQYFTKNRLDLKTNGEFDLSKIYLNCILIIRILLLKKNNEDAWRRFCVLESMLERWKEAPGWLQAETENMEMVVHLLGPELVTPDEVLRVIAVCNTNTFSKYLEPDGITSMIGSKTRVIYILTSMMSHSCVPNAEQSIASQFDGLRLVVRSTRPIKKGEQILISYVDLLEPTLMRQYSLITGKLFSCSCARCVDPNELGSNCGQIRCPTCLRQKTQPPGKVVSCSKDMSSWACTVCGTRSPVDKVKRLVFKVAGELEELLANSQATLQDYEKFLSKYTKLLGNQHGLLLKVKYQLCGFYGRSIGFTLPELTETSLKRKQDLCEDMMGVLDIIQPGLTSRRGCIFYELHAALLVIGRSKLETDKPSAVKLLKSSLDFLEQSLEILAHEPKGTFFFKIFTGATESKPQLIKFIQAIQ